MFVSLSGADKLEALTVQAVGASFIQGILFRFFLHTLS
ncbi:hypothetical protein YpsIP31758_2208 [Yersinia pseudotuberculosis IP 31758]|uniref:Uncharacterized protein n=1 Tax=Yersinia pseudotuberculosis serotype O:1b (strain IP 31758) TaxID=349747 RepID=A0A0U1QVK4_YERP3|nr:hypothetical protein YpsIP31758_2208 [Yersinia pseudotuberculosis IP 31758]